MNEFEWASLAAKLGLRWAESGKDIVFTCREWEEAGGCYALLNQGSWYVKLPFAPRLEVDSLVVAFEEIDRAIECAVIPMQDEYWYLRPTSEWFAGR